MAEQKKQEVKVPEAPSVLPAGEVENWKKRYVAGYEDSKAHDSEAQESVHHGYALREANRLLAVPKLTSLSQADALPKWKVLKRERKKDDSVTVVTIDGRKYNFAKGAGKEKDDDGAPAPAAPAAGNGQQKTA